VDSVNVTFGVRSLRFDASSGFYLNGVATKIFGAANHQVIGTVFVIHLGLTLVWDVLHVHVHSTYFVGPTLLVGLGFSVGFAHRVLEVRARVHVRCNPTHWHWQAKQELCGHTILCVCPCCQGVGLGLGGGLGPGVRRCRVFFFHPSRPVCVGSSPSCRTLPLLVSQYPTTCKRGASES
jgi:hypothetical protein